MILGKGPLAALPLVLCLTFGLPQAFWGQAKPLVPTVKGIGLLADNQFEAVAKLQAEILKADPSGLHWAFIMATKELWLLLLNPETKAAESLDASAERLWDLAGKQSAQAEAGLFKAAAALYKAEAAKVKGSSLAALSWMERSRSWASAYHKQGNPDASLMVGCFDFYLSPKHGGYKEELDLARKGQGYCGELAVFMAARFAAEDGDWVASREAAAQAVERFPHNSLAWFYYAKALDHSQRYDEALKACDSGLANLDPAKPLELGNELLFVKAQVLERYLGDFKGALRTYEGLLKMIAASSSPGPKRLRALAYLHSGFCLERLGDRTQAMAAWAKVARADDSKAFARAKEAMERKP